MKGMGRLAVLMSLAVCGARTAGGAPWDVSVEMRFNEDGVTYAAEAGLPLLEKLMDLPRREKERVFEDEVDVIGRAVAQQLRAVNRLSINGAENAPQVSRFGIAGERNEDGTYASNEAVARFEVRHAALGSLRSVEIVWGLLPERYFSSDAINDLVEYLESRDRSSLIQLRIGSEPPVELEMREGKTGFTWERAGEDLSAPVREEAGGAPSDRGAAKGRVFLIAILAVLLILRVALKNFVWRPEPR